VEVVLGDARVSMEREKETHEREGFDVLAVDAFSSDAIPVHLLTRECFELYQYHLREDGILALHVSNRYFDFRPVARSLASVEPQRGFQALWVRGAGLESQGTSSSDWVLLTVNQQFITSSEVQRAVADWSDDDRPPLLWTDDYSNLFRLLR
jgi:spermidine synthase